jgi:hypothetical protein
MEMAALAISMLKAAFSTPTLGKGKPPAGRELKFGEEYHTLQPLLNDFQSLTRWEIIIRDETNETRCKTIYRPCGW